MDSGLIEGIFIEEEKRRFSCIVEVEGVPEKCYVASSCKIEKLIPLGGKKVLLKPVQSKLSDMKYSLFAVQMQKGLVLLNLPCANRVVENQLLERKFCYLGNRKEIEREKVIEGYKSDLYLPESNTVIEVKTILSDKREGRFPSSTSVRVKKQLSQILELLDKGYQVCYLFIVLNPTTKQVKLGDELKQIFEECIAKGMICKAYALKFFNESPVIHKCVKIII